jgi:lipopolysaccharide transport system permease protein
LGRTFGPGGQGRDSVEFQRFGGKKREATANDSHGKPKVRAAPVRAAIPRRVLICLYYATAKLRFHRMSRAAINSNRSPFAFALDLWRHRELLWQFTRREVELRHRGSHLGLAWSLLNPLLILGLYVFVFGFIFGGHFGVLPHESRVDYALGIFLGLSLFQFLAEIITVTPGLVVANPNFVKKVVFPLEILPAATVGAAVFHLVISLTLVLAGVALFGGGLTAGVCWLPVLVLPLALFALGLAWIIAALGVFLRDLSQLAQFLSMTLLYSSAVFYPVEKIPAALWQLLRFNPLLLTVDLARNAILWNRALNPRHLAYVFVLSLLMCYVGHRLFRRLKPAFADVI